MRHLDIKSIYIFTFSREHVTTIYMIIELNEINTCSYLLIGYTHTHTHLGSCIIGDKIDLIFKLSTDIPICRTILIENQSDVSDKRK